MSVCRPPHGVWTLYVLQHHHIGVLIGYFKHAVRAKVGKSGQFLHQLALVSLSVMQHAHAPPEWQNVVM